VAVTADHVLGVGPALESGVVRPAWDAIFAA
jgi:hypothetical protein